MLYHVRHQTQYEYSAEVAHSQQLLHLVPRPAPYQQCLEHALQITPHAHERRDGVDFFGNPMTRIELEHPHRQLTVIADMDVRVYSRPLVPASDSVRWEAVRDALAYRFGRPPSSEQLAAVAFRHESPYVRIKRVFALYAADCFTPGRPLLACADALSAKLHRDFRYAPGETTVQTPLLEVLEQRRGVCQDFAHLMIACLRAHGLAVRYVSGYVRRLARRSGPQESTEPDSVAEPGRGDGASHAWVSVYSPPFGWVEIDPTNSTRVTGDHIAVAWGRDFGDVSPLRGVILGGGNHRPEVQVAVHEVDERRVRSDVPSGPAAHTLEAKGMG